MNLKHLNIVVLILMFLTSCFTSNNKKSPRQLKREDGKCDGKVLRKEMGAVHPSSLTTKYFVVDNNGDSIEIDVKIRDMSDQLRFTLFGYDNSIPVKYHKGKKGKRFTGMTINLLFENDKHNPMPGCYKVVNTFENGLPLYRFVYYPNGQLKLKIKGINKGMASTLQEHYDYNGELLRRELHQAGLYFVNVKEQKQGTFNVETRRGQTTRLIEKNLPYSELYVIERITAYQRISWKFKNENYLPYVADSRLEHLILQKSYAENNHHVHSHFSCTFFDYLFERKRMFNYETKDSDPDTVFRLHIEYLDYGGIKTLGQYFMNLRHGIWNYYNNDGSLKDVELYSEGRRHFSLHDDNAFVYFHVLYDKEKGEVLQYKNDWIPHFRPDSMFLFNYNDYVWHHHERKKGSSFEYWPIQESLDISNKLNFRNYMRTFHRKEHFNDGRIKSIGFVSDKGLKIGVWIDFSHCGDTVTIYDKYYGEDNGIFRKYIKSELVENRNEIPISRLNDQYFYTVLPIQHEVKKYIRRNYWFRQWQEK